MEKIQNKTGKKAKKTPIPAHQWTVDYIMSEFEKESDRAAVILVASVLEETLLNLLRNFFIAIPNSTDPLFDSATAPLATFSAKIDICYRLGLISNRLCRDLHLIRKIRNIFAHDIYGCNFENGSIKARVDELYKSANALNSENESPARKKFHYISSGIIWMLNAHIQTLKPLFSSPLEGIYSDKQ